MRVERDLPEACGRAPALIAALYDIERALPDVVDLDAWESAETLALRERISEERSRPIVDSLATRAFEQRATPGSGFAKLSRPC
jgi:hypothetical protein